MNRRLAKNRTYGAIGGPTCAIFGLVILGVLSGCTPRASDEAPISGRFTPPPGKTLLLIGQDLGSVRGYVDSIPVIPGGITTYTDLSEGEHEELLWGLEGTVDYGAGPVSGRASVEPYPQSALAIGLYMVDNSGTNLQHIVDGTHDEAIDRLGRFITASARPVYLRIGYEFDGAWNHYEPDAYVGAFRYIVDRLRDRSVDNVTTVWQSATSVWGTYRDLPFEAWYPGDEYADWLGMSYFTYDAEIFDRFLAFARAHSKPVMIAESAPQGYDVEDGTRGNPADSTAFERPPAEDIWREWYAPFFQFIDRNSDVIRAVAYINCDWNEQAMWQPDGGNGYWGDSRVQANEEIRDRWLDEIRKPLWQHGSPRLNRILGYDVETGPSNG